MTLMFVNGLWKHGIILVHGTLDQNQESDLPYYESHNHIHEDDHSYEDGFCDCNSQGNFFFYFNANSSRNTINILRIKQYIFIFT